MHRTKVTVIDSPNLWIEGEAVRQLNKASELEGMQRVVGLPDIHPGKGYPIGAAFLSKDVLHPILVGNDVGCGMQFSRLNISGSKLKPEKLASKMEGLDTPWDIDYVQKYLKDKEIEGTGFEKSLSTVGAGNHFIEAQIVHEILDPDWAEKLSSNLYLLVHTGSRGLGESIFHEVAAKHEAKGLPIDSEEGRNYLKQHDNAVKWARANRTLCGQRVAEAFNTDIKCLLDSTHNSVTVTGDEALHRKGAAPATDDLLVVPGSRGDLTYLVQPIPSEKSLFSVAHGAGRKMSRLETFERSDSNWQVNPWGGRVVCGDNKVAKEEAPGGYKKVATVVQALIDHGLVKVIATLRPVVTFKSSSLKEESKDKDWRQQRRQSNRR